ncbi:restriction endonuclease subunit S [Lactococcus lactis]|uniref:restriction endonuclease subunit S n=1 Tax=Lactococcus lactis TaxID=1358 RepID=UPI000BF9D1B7|nr:restriction endonuclease subunit S [Lactococcus lactis]PFG82981.1 type I site-specific deoxyribonuclease [Lactococcus lactis]
MKEKVQAPQLRFDGFTDDWEERKLAEFTTSFSGGTPSAGNSSYYKGDIPFIRSGEINSDKTELFLTEDGLKNSSAKMVSVGDILYALYGATSGEVGISQINGAINQAILAIKPCDGYNSHFLMQWLKLQKQRIIDKYLQGGQGNLSGSIVKNLVLNVPNFEEQKKIGTFFKQLDDTITLHQRKLDLLKEQKKGYLQKMFPKNGSKIPELRFEGFTDDWELRKFGEMLVNLEAGVSVNSSDYDTGYFILKTSAIKMGNIDLLEVKSIVSEEVARAKTPLIKNSIIISRMNTPELVGASGLVRESIDNIFLPDRLWQGQVAGNFSPEWLIQSINIAANIKKIRDLATGTSGSMKNISKKSMLDLIINVPTLEEQQKIGSFFKQLDDVIALHQLKLDLLKEQKKGFLQKMFA